MSGVTNQELVTKATNTTNQLASAGKLNPAQSDKFIDYVVDQTELKNNARVVRFTNETLQIDKIGVGRRVAVPAAEATESARPTATASSAEYQVSASIAARQSSTGVPALLE